MESLSLGKLGPCSEESGVGEGGAGSAKYRVLRQVYELKIDKRVDHHGPIKAAFCGSVP